MLCTKTIINLIVKKKINKKILKNIKFIKGKKFNKLNYKK